MKRKGVKIPTIRVPRRSWRVDENGGGNIDTPWRKARRSVKPIGETIVSTPPQIVTAITHGPDALARNFFPDVLEAPHIDMSEEEAIELTLNEQRRRMKA